ncbi:MAG: hypothetical protein AAGA92_04840 [Planctomycetota bacterium]
MNPLRAQTLLSLPVLSLLAGLYGCEKPSGLVPVAGRVSVDGEPLAGGTIRFFPSSGRPVSSAILEDGSFQLAEVTVGQTMQDGITPGDYRIAVSASEITGEDAEDVIWRAPAKYADFRTSGLETEITGPVEDLKIDLTWEGSEPDKPEGDDVESQEEPLVESEENIPTQTDSDGSAAEEIGENAPVDPAAEEDVEGLPE